MKRTEMERSVVGYGSRDHADDAERMTSLEIAEVTGKQHKNVMQAIRNMEAAWTKTCGLKFQLTSREVMQPNGGTREVPCYALTKTECLYVATKFNDEARARLVLRWEELERARLAELQQQMRQRMGDMVQLLTCEEEVLNEADNILGEELDRLNSRSDACFTPTEIARPLGMEGRDLNAFLADQGIISWCYGQWRLTRDYEGQGLTENRCFYYHGRNGRRKMESRLVWTEKGRRFVMERLQKD